MADNKNSTFIQGIWTGVSIAIGYLPAALTFGLLAKGTGLTLWETVAMSMFVYAGATQYMALNLIAIGTGAFEIIFTTFIVNIRHLLMSAAVSQKVEKDHPVKKALYSFGITDEVFAMLTTQKNILKTNFIFGVGAIAYTSWVVSSAIGYAIGAVLPKTLQMSMGIALYAMFIALLMPALKKERKVLYLALSAAILNTIFSFILPTGWSIIVSTLIASFGIEWVIQEGRFNE